MNSAVQNMGHHLSKLGNFMPFLFVFFLYLLVIRPQQKKEKKRQEMIANLKKGDIVLTSAGIKGAVERVSDNDILIAIAEGTSVSFAKNAIAHIVDRHKVDRDVSPRHSSYHRKKKAGKNLSQVSKTSQSPNQPPNDAS